MISIDYHPGTNYSQLVLFPTDYFIRLLQRCPLEFLKSNIIRPIIEQIIPNCSLEHRDASASMIAFLQSLAKLTSTSKKESKVGVFEKYSLFLIETFLSLRIRPSINRKFVRWQCHYVKRIFRMFWRVWFAQLLSIVSHHQSVDRYQILFMTWKLSCRINFRNGYKQLFEKFRVQVKMDQWKLSPSNNMNSSITFYASECDRLEKIMCFFFLFTWGI